MWIIFFHTDFIGREKNGKNKLEIDYARTNYDIDLQIMDVQKFQIKLLNNKLELFYDNKLITNYPNYVFMKAFDNNLGHFFNSKGINYNNNIVWSMISEDKMATHIYLAELGIKMPDTIYCSSKNSEDYSYDDLTNKFGPKFILKATHGTQGANVHLVDSEKQFYELLKKYNFNCIFQEFIASSFGKDVRATIIDGKCVTTSLRESKDDFRSNMALGGKPKPYKVDKKLEKLAEQIAKKMNLWICGIDFLIGKDDEYYVCEVNCVPSFKVSEKLNYFHIIDLIAIENKKGGN